MGPSSPQQLRQAEVANSPRRAYVDNMTTTAAVSPVRKAPDNQLLRPTQRKRLLHRLPLGVRVIGWVLLVAVAHAIVSGYLARRSCEHRGGVYSTDLHACLRVPR